MSKEKNLNDIITKELAETFDRYQLEAYVLECVKARGYCQLRARNSQVRFFNFTDEDPEGRLPGSFHACYLGVVMGLLHEWGFHTERIVATGTNAQIGECDVYVTLQGMVEPRELHRLFSSASPQEIGAATNPIHTVLRISQPVKMERMEVTNSIANAYNDPLLLTQTNPVGLRSLIIAVTLTAALVALVAMAVLQSIT
ncbi:MAG: hypothetical protein IJ767_04285 [Bacteroidaceae bacterium]|nr:hypothetical protein [Bacteroidaceae bacterium]